MDTTGVYVGRMAETGSFPHLRFRLPQAGRSVRIGPEMRSACNHWVAEDAPELFHAWHGYCFRERRENPLDF